MTHVNFSSAEIEVLIHATEDSLKVLGAIEKLLSIEPNEFHADIIKGHFGNEITRLRANLGSQRATELAYKIINTLPEEDRDSIYENFHLHTDGKNSIYLRLSKQKLFEDKVTLDQTDSLKIRLKAVKRFQSRTEMDNFRKELKGVLQ